MRRSLTPLARAAVAAVARPPMIGAGPVPGMRLATTRVTAEHRPRPRGKAAKAAQELAAADCSPLVDLTAGVPADAAPYAAVKHWVVFSDLHVCDRTLDASLAALRAVRAEVKARGPHAGALFLGDWWHARGSLPVRPLNAVLEELSMWTHPTLMLVGNHDLAGAGGADHALAPLAAALPTCHVFDSPSLFLGALWLPYRRDAGELAAAAAAAASSPSPPTAVFAHADVVGAVANDAFQSAAGVDPCLFPAATWLGHYHKPHAVKTKKGQPPVRYVGSPYQVSAGEAGQDKALVVLKGAVGKGGKGDAGRHSWAEVAAVPLAVGPRHHALAGAAPSPPSDLRPGDRVRWTVPAGIAPAVADAAADALRAAGARVELVLSPPPSRTPRLPADALSRGPGAIFAAYADHVGMSPAGRAAGDAALARAGGGAPPPGVSLSLHTVTVDGYGPFADPVQYNLGAGGVRVLTGRNDDDVGADSNGAGKTSLAMAAHWALTGRSDARMEGGGGRGLAHGDVVCDARDAASVVVKGEANGAPFRVERAVTRKKLTTLSFHLAGVDASGPDARLTQAAIDAALGGALISRAAFLGQSDVMSLIEAGDGELKAALAAVALDGDAWDAAKVAAAAALKEAKAVATTATADADACSRQAAALSAEAAAAEADAAAWEAQRGVAVCAASADRDAHASRLATALVACSVAANSLQAWMEMRAGGDWREAEAPPARSAVVAALAVAHPPTSSDDEFHLFDIDAYYDDPLALGVDTDAWAAGDDVAGDDGPPLSLAPAARAPPGFAAPWPADLASLATAAEAAAERAASEATAAAASAGAAAGAARAAAAAADEYAALAYPSRSHAHSGPVCDRCLQPVSRAAYDENLGRLKGVAARAAAATASAAAAAAAARAAADQAAAAAAARRTEERAAERAGAAEREAAARHAAAAADDAATVAAAAAAARRAVARHSDLLAECGHDALAPALGGLPAGADDATARTAASAASASADAADAAAAALAGARADERALAGANPHAERARSLAALAEAEASRAAARAADTVAASADADAASEADAALGSAGARSYALEGALADLQDRVAAHLAVLSPGAALTLSATRAASATGRADIERISKMVTMRSGDAIVERSLRALSGGERRRVALAFALGFADLAAARGRLSCDTLILDEVLQHLDDAGCAAVARLLRSLPRRTVLVVAQADSFAEREFDAVDVVVKKGGRSSVVVAQG